MAKQQGREMVNEARAYRERVLSELARRRELARQQIEQLIHGRDRLLQAFERSRAVAVDVMAELTPLGEPTEYVDLSPTTGPGADHRAARPLRRGTPARRDGADGVGGIEIRRRRSAGGSANDDASATTPDPVHLELVSDDDASDAVVLEIASAIDDAEIAAAGDENEAVEPDDGADVRADVASVIELFSNPTSHSSARRRVDRGARRERRQRAGRRAREIPERRP